MVLSEVTLSIENEQALSQLLEEMKRRQRFDRIISAKTLILLSVKAEHAIVSREIPDCEAYGIKYHWRECAPISAGLFDVPTVTQVKTLRLCLIRRTLGWHVQFISFCDTPAGSPTHERVEMTVNARDYILERQKVRKLRTEQRQALLEAA